MQIPVPNPYPIRPEIFFPIPEPDPSRSWKPLPVGPWWDVFWDNLAIYHVRFSFYDSLTFWRSEITKKINQKIKKFLLPQKNDFECKIDVFGHKWSQIYCFIELKWKIALLQFTGPHFWPQNGYIFMHFLNMCQDLIGPQGLMYFNAKYS